MADAATTTTTDTTTTTAPPAVDWAAHVPQEYAATFEPYKGKSLADVFKGYGEAAKMIGQRPQGVKIPGDNATPEERATFNKALGVPDAPEGYRIQRPDIAASAWDEAAEQSFFKTAHTQGMTPKMVQAVVNWYGQFIADQQNASRRESDAVMAELRQEFGSTLDAKLGRANRAFQLYGGDTLVDHYAKNGMARDPLTIKAWIAIADELVEAGAMEIGGTSATMSPGDIQAELDDIAKQLNTLPENHPKRKDLIDRKIALINSKGRAA